jgi:hypothetical protein
MICDGIKWAYGVTTVSTRLNTTLPVTLASLATGGFPSPRLFVDGCKNVVSLEQQFGLQVTCHYPALLTAGNWILSLYELYLRDHSADRYAIFQDDFVTYRNLRQYLEAWQYTSRTYWNLYTFPENQWICPRDKHGWKIGWFRSRDCSKDTPGFQVGRGAVALVFDNETTMCLLSHPHLVRRAKDPRWGHRKIDGGIVEALNQQGWTEYVDNPSLVQHIGHKSSIGNKPHPQAPQWRGENFDALDLLKEI